MICVSVTAVRSSVRRGSAIGASAALSCALLATALVAPAPAQQEAALRNPARATPPTPGSRSFALRARAVYPVTPEQPGPIARGVVVVRDGRIAAVGQDLPVPPDLPLINLPHAVVCPGLVSAGRMLEFSHAGPEAVSGAYHALDACDGFAENLAALAVGTTTAHVDPGNHRLVSGVGAVVKLAGPAAERTLVAAADLKVNLGVFDPPLLFRPPVFASSDEAIQPAQRQRPDSRLGQYLELEQRIAAAERWIEDPESFARERARAAVAPKLDVHSDAFIEAWAAAIPLRIEARRAEDIDGALRLIRQLRAGGTPRRQVHLVGVDEADRLAGELAAADVPLVVQVHESYRGPAPNVGGDPEALAPELRAIGRLAATAARIALIGAHGDAPEDLRLAAMLAVRGGMSPEQALAAITRVPAEILGVDQRVGSLAADKDADLLVLTGEPLDVNSAVWRVYVGGQLVFELRAPRATSATQPTAQVPPVVVRAGTVWVGDGSIVHDGSVLIENGKIRAVGQRVPHPPGATIIDGGAEGFVVPGFIDAHGHLGLDGDMTAVGPETAVHRVVGTATREFRRVARAGVTTVLLAPYRATAGGARMAAVKTYGTTRAELVARELCGVRFGIRGQDPLTAMEDLRRVLQAGKKYDDEWKRYEAELAKWKASGGKPTTQPKADADAATEQANADPVTGTWSYTISGAPLPAPVSGKLTMRLSGGAIEARLTDPTGGEDVTATGTLVGHEITLEIDAETPMGRPVLRATIDREDHLTGHVSVGEFELSFEATRTDKSAVEFKVRYVKKRAKDGRPTPPKVDEKLEPLRALLAGRVPAAVEVATAGEIQAALKLFVDEFKVPLVLLGAEAAADVADALRARREYVGVVVPREIERTRQGARYTQIVELSRRDVPASLQSDSEDGARALPAMALYAVRQGLGGDSALRALTVDAARMYRLHDRLGSLEPGKDGDLLVFKGHPFDAGSRLEHVIVGGREVPDE